MEKKPLHHCPTMARFEKGLESLIAPLMRSLPAPRSRGEHSFSRSEDGKLGRSYLSCTR